MAQRTLARVTAVGGLLAGVATLVLIDLVLAAAAGNGDFVADLRGFLRWGGLASMAAGVLTGHWFHPGEMDGGVLGRPGSMLTLIGTSLIVVGLSAGLHYGGVATIPPLVPLLIGVAAGALLWPV